ncbi:MAG: hypothetical protein V4481_05545 [Patescibacteria group bacterium]
MTPEELTKNADLQKVVTEGVKIYQQIKDLYEPIQNGKFMAIDIDSKKAYVADTSADAVVMARKEHPQKVFYVVKIGFDAAETIAHLFTKNK